MKTLSKHNKDIEAHFKLMRETAHLAGVICDTCKTQLQYSDPNMTNLTYPPTKWVFCPNKKCPDYKEKTLKTV